jgi:hypothetical protein
MPGTARTIGWGGVLGQISWLCGVNVKSTKDGKLCLGLDTDGAFERKRAGE